MHSHILAQTIPRTKSKRLMGIRHITSIPRIGLQPSLRDEAVGIREVGFGVESRVLVDRDARFRWEDFTKDYLSSGRYNTRTTNWHWGINAKRFLETFI